MGNTGKDNRRVGKPENYCGSYPFKKKKKKKRVNFRQEEG